MNGTVVNAEGDRYVCFRHPNALLYRTGLANGTGEHNQIWGHYQCGQCGGTCAKIATVSGFEVLAMVWAPGFVAVAHGYPEVAT